MLPAQDDLFDQPYALTPEQRKKLGRDNHRSKKRGHIMPPGTGPVGETCGSCAHLVRRKFAKVYLKCGLNRAEGRI